MTERNFAEQIQQVQVPGGTVARERTLSRVGMALMILGVVLGAVGYGRSFTVPSGEIDQAQNDAIVLAGIGIAVSILGLALFLRYSLGALLRLWLARLVADRDAS